MKEKFILGPLQKLWVEQLKKHPERQLLGKLGSGTAKKYQACCLGEGLLCYYRIKHKKLPINNSLHDSSGSGLYLNDDYEKLGLRSKTGDLKYRVKKVINGKEDIFHSLSKMNDAGYTWPQIAKYIERNPEKVFIKSV